MTRQTIALDLTDEEIACRLREAREDEHEGRLVHCESEIELREFFGTLRHQA